MQLSRAGNNKSLFVEPDDADPIRAKSFANSSLGAVWFSADTDAYSALARRTKESLKETSHVAPRHLR
jgi:hypothetical protein